MKTAITFLLSFLFLSKSIAMTIIPQPVSCKVGEGTFTLNRQTVISTAFNHPILLQAADFYREMIEKQSGVSLSLGQQSQNIIELNLLSPPVQNSEHYTLSVTPTVIRIYGASYNAFAHALQTLFQLCLNEPLYLFRNSSDEYLFQTAEITDYPQFAWRGMHLDVSRHFFPIDSIYTYIDMLALHKMNTFHWHLTDDQGWRVEIKKYPKLTQIGAFRRDKEGLGWGENYPWKPSDKPTYGGFYTQREIKSLVDYASKRGITIVPEIDMPGHASAIFAAYPQFSCSQKPQNVPANGVYPDTMSTCFCVGNDSVYSFVEDVLSELITLFPSQYIHIGGDEVDTQRWSKCPKCKAKYQQIGAVNYHELQNYFMNRVVSYLTSKGRKAIGWDEILQDKLDKNTAVMVWRSAELGKTAAENGHYVIMSPGEYCYFDTYQDNPDNEPLAIGGFLSPQKVYTFDPVKDIPKDLQTYFLGGQANLWAEYIHTFSHVQYMVLPRMSALSEALWTLPKNKDFENFNQRLDIQRHRFELMGWNFHKGLSTVDYSLEKSEKEVKLTLTNESNGVIYYTLDGKNPTLKSNKYESPIVLRKPTVVKSIVVKNNQVLGKVAGERVIGTHLGYGKKITYNQPFSEQFPASRETALVDGMTGTTHHNDKINQGFLRNDLDVIISLDTTVKITKVSASFFQNPSVWVFLPSQMEVYGSVDGTAFEKLGMVKQTISPLIEKPVKQMLSISVKSKKKFKYVKVVAENLIVPEGHPAKGQKEWLFCDEIFVE